MKYILLAPEAMTLATAGGKASALAQSAIAGLPVPPWFVIMPNAYYDSLSTPAPAQNDSHEFPVDIHFAESVKNEIATAAATLGHSGYFAVRSSAVEEDGIEHSFAGQLESYLYVTADAIQDKVAEVWRSGFASRLLQYRKDNGINSPLTAPAVIVQIMIDAESAGVAFAVDPVTGDPNTAVVAAVYGLGTALVSGDENADTYFIGADGTASKQVITVKSHAQRLDAAHGQGVCTVAVPEALRDKPALSPKAVAEVAALVRRASTHFGRPQDIEWAYTQERLHLLQSRPITRLRRAPDPGELAIWDNSNITESYGGVTTPLTFSFARRAYEEVYRQFCKIMHVPAAIIAENNSTFKRMLGLIQGRVYYHLLSWYRMLALFPGFTLNRRFMEQMMGVKEGLPESIAKTLKFAGIGARMRDGGRFAGTVAGMVFNHFSLAKKIRAFYQRLNSALALTNAELEKMPADALARYYRSLEQQLLTRWDAPLINDFFAMIFYGILRKLAQSWCADTQGSLQNDLLCGQGGMISAEPAQRIRAMAEIIKGDAAWIDSLLHDDLGWLIPRLADHATLHRAYRDYLDKFGDRCMEELKLESETLHDNPLLLLRSVGQLARKLRMDADSDKAVNVEKTLRDAAQRRVAQMLKYKPVRRTVFNWVLKNARARVRDRENLRFERTRLFGRVRRIFLSIGDRLMREGRLHHPRDIFYLEVEEILGFIEGTTTTTRLAELSALRRREFDEFRAQKAPPDRFSTRGAVHLAVRQSTPSAAVDGDAHRRQGIACCPGRVRGRARVITDPRHAQLHAGDILVAERTDPGWTMLFPAAAGILVERGSLLSHSAIVAREMGIPAIVSIHGLTRWIKDGDTVEFDGASGWIQRTESESHP